MDKEGARKDLEVAFSMVKEMQMAGMKYTPKEGEYPKFVLVALSAFLREKGEKALACISDAKMRIS